MLKTSVWPQAETDRMVQEAVKFHKMHRLSQAEIDRMIQEAVEFRAEDERLAAG